MAAGPPPGLAGPAGHGARSEWAEPHLGVGGGLEGRVQHEGPETPVEVGAVGGPGSQRGMRIPGGGAGRQDGGAGAPVPLCRCGPALSHVCEGGPPASGLRGGGTGAVFTAPATAGRAASGPVGGGGGLRCARPWVVSPTGARAPGAQGQGPAWGRGGFFAGQPGGRGQGRVGLGRRRGRAGVRLGAEREWASAWWK